jgi:hypothetical protein
MASSLTRYFVSEDTQGSSERNAADVSRQPHAASISSETK